MASWMELHYVESEPCFLTPIGNVDEEAKRELNDRHGRHMFFTGDSLLIPFVTDVAEVQAVEFFRVATAQTFGRDVRSSSHRWSKMWPSTQLTEMERQAIKLGLVADVKQFSKGFTVTVVGLNEIEVVTKHRGLLDQVGPADEAGIQMTIGGDVNVL